MIAHLFGRPAAPDPTPLVEVVRQLSASLTHSQTVIAAQARVIARQGDRIAELKKLGHESAVSVSLRPEQQEAPVPDIVTAAIEQLAQPGTALAARLTRLARSGIARGLAPSDVARGILMGGDQDSRSHAQVMEMDEDDDEVNIPAQRPMLSLTDDELEADL